MFLYCDTHREDGQDFKGGLEQGRLKLDRKLIALIEYRIELVKVWAQGQPNLDEVRFTDYTAYFGTSSYETGTELQWERAEEKGVRFKQKPSDGDQMVVSVTGNFYWITRPANCVIYVETPVTLFSELKQWKGWLDAKTR